MNKRFMIDSHQIEMNSKDSGATEAEIMYYTECRLASVDEMLVDRLTSQGIEIKI